ncbi:hypothetical protein D3C87_1727160 [compost metagenome]
MGKVALHVHLRLLTVRGRRQRDDAKDPWADALGDGLDRSAFTGAVTAFEQDAYLGASVHDPLLEFDQLDMQARQLLFIRFRR